jgi:hypothetical protein
MKNSAECFWITLADPAKNVSGIIIFNLPDTRESNRASLSESQVYKSLRKIL